MIDPNEPLVGAARPDLTSGHLVARNTALNLLGQVAPMLVAIPSVPLLISGLGTERFGVLALILMAIGYFGLFDLGIGRALTQLVAQKLGRDQEGDLPAVVWPALLLMALLGLAGSAALALLSEQLVSQVLRVPAEYQAETVQAFYILSVSLPFVITTAGLIGILAAYQRFEVVNAVGVPMGAMAFLAPAVVASVTESLVATVTTLVVVRFLGWLAYAIACVREHDFLREPVVWRSDTVRALLGFGGWMTISNVVGPLMVYMDRFILGALLSMSAVAYYVAPYELVTKLWAIPAALLASLFPAFASSFSADGARTRLLFDGGVTAVFLAVFPPALLLISFAPEGLRLWLGDEFALHGAPVLRWLAAGVFLNCLAQVPFAAVQGIGRPDVTAKLHLLEFPIYLAGFIWLVGILGIEGAAIAWVLRVALDALALFWFARKFLPSRRATTAWEAVAFLGSLATFGIAGTLPGVAARVTFVIMTMTVFAAVFWRVVKPHGLQLVRTILFTRG